MTEHEKYNINVNDVNISNDIIHEQNISLAREDVEYTGYVELLQGFLQKFTRWQEVAKEEKYLFSYHPLGYEPGSTIITESWRSRFEVFQTSQGIDIGPVHDDSDDERELKLNRILYADISYDHSQPHGSRPDRKGTYGNTTVMMKFKAGFAGKQFLVDPDKEPLEAISIDVDSYWVDEWRELGMHAVYPNKPYPQTPSRDIQYVFNDNTLKIAKWFPYLENSVSMPAAYQMHMINTIDALIPTTNSSTPQNERRGGTEPPKPKSLSPAQRKPGG